MDAKLIKENEWGVQIRLATRREQTWPGYHESCPLGKAGYWLGNHSRHDYYGRGKDALRKAEQMFYA